MENKIQTGSEIKKIVDYYVLTNKLKEVVRTGWKVWNVAEQRVESIAEHIYGTCMLAVAIWSQTLPPVNLGEVLLTLALHETEEIVIGDMTFLDENYENKNQKGREAVLEIFKEFKAREVFVNLLDNFESKSTPEAVFAYKCDKLECDLQAKIYCERGSMTLEKADEKIKQNAEIVKMQQAGIKKASSFFIQKDKSILKKYADDNDDMFLQISNYIQKNKIL